MKSKKRKNNLDKTPVITGSRADPRIKISKLITLLVRVQELCESRGGRPGLSGLMSLMVSVDVKQH